MSSPHTTSTTTAPIRTTGPARSVVAGSGRTTRGADRTLRRSVLLDAGISGVSGLLLTAGAAALDTALGIPTGWVLGLGLFVLVSSAGVLTIARRLPRSAGLVRPLAAANAAWAVASVAVVLLDVWPLTTMGIAVVLAQAAVVDVLSIMHWRAAAAVRTS